MILVFTIEQGYDISGVEKEVHRVHYFFGVP